MKAQRAAWQQEFAGIDPSRLVFLDESGTTTNMTRRYGRAPRGQRIDAAVPHGHHKLLTLTAAVRLGEVGACLVFEGATNSLCFESYIEMCLLPTLRVGDIVIMDNLPAHKSAEVERLIDSVGAVVRYLPAYSPDFNPIEQLFSKLKEYLRSVGVRTVEALYGAIGDGLRTIKPSDIQSWFGHSGYRYTQ